MVNEKLIGPQKAAVFLFSIGEELASSIVKYLNEDEIRKLGNLMSKIPVITPGAAENIFSEFNELASSQMSIPVGRDGGTQFIKKVVSKAIEGEKAQALLEEIQDEGKCDLFKKIRRLDPRTLANFIKTEHPQTIAVILAYLDPSQSAEILSEFPGPLKTEVLYRIAELENMPPGIVEEIDLALQEEISSIKSFDGQKQGGVRLVAEILNGMDSETETSVLKGIEEQKQNLAEEIRKLMFVFEDLGQVDDRSIVAILKDINNETLMAALKTASDELKEKIFKNMSDRAGQMLKEDLEVMGPVRLKDVEAAQQSILKLAKKLESEGKIVLMSKGKEEVFV